MNLLILHVFDVVAPLIFFSDMPHNPIVIVAAAVDRFSIFPHLWFRRDARDMDHPTFETSAELCGTHSMPDLDGAPSASSTPIAFIRGSL